MEKQTKRNKRQLSPIQKALSICISVAVGVWLVPRILILLVGIVGLSWKSFDTVEAFKEAGGQTMFEVPENAENCKFMKRRLKAYMYTFELEQSDFQTYVENLIEEYDLNNVDGDEGDAKYGYPAWYGKKVRECCDLEYSLDNFPVGLPFDKLIPDDVKEYTILVYDPSGSGTYSYGVVVNEEARRVVVYEEHHP